MKTPPPEAQAEDRVVDPHAKPLTSSSTNNRRTFLRNVAWTAGAVSMSPLLQSKSTRAEAAHFPGLDGRERATEAFTIRRDAATTELFRRIPDQLGNGDERRYSNKIGNFSKGLPHNSLGEVDLSAYGRLLSAIRSGQPSDFENIPLGGNTRLTNPQAGLAFALEGPDAAKTFEPPSPALASRERAAEAIEVYWMALLRDVPFSQYAANPLALQACEELGKLSDFRGPRINGRVTPQTLFRGFTAGDVVGPYVSQFLLQPVGFGSLPMEQTYVTYQPGVDYMTDVNSWLAVQNGAGPFGTPVRDSQRFLRDGRGGSTWVHLDLLFQAYFMGMLWLLGHAGLNVNNPYNTSRTQFGFGTFGGPHITALLAEVSGYALRAQWFQKWWVHRALRPEAYGGLVHFSKTSAASYPISADVLNSHAVAETFARHGSYLLPMAFPEGSPTHPSYGSGHATVAGACVTVLKAFFNTDAVFPSPVEASSDGASLVPYTGTDASRMTLTGELNKLANNIAQWRNIAGVHWRSDATQAILLGEAVAMNLLAAQRRCYNETFAGFRFTKFDGTLVTI